MKTGRKSLKEEIKIVERMTALSEPVFKFILNTFNTDDKADKKWASEQMMKLYAKAVPTEITGEDGAAFVVHIAKEVATKNNIDEPDTSASDNSEGQQ